ncbi:MAG: DUF4923 family protein [Bacteroidales bacterium]|nr:DUF4923 family protein [Bacteroidales bacterium]
MKKLVIVLAAAMFAAGTSANAQGLSSLLKSVTGSSTAANTVTSLVRAYTGVTDAVSLPGSWTYAAPAVSLEGSSTVANVAGTAAASQVEEKMNEYLSKVGIKAGAVSFVFNEDLSFTCTVKNVPLNGTWKTLNDGASVQLQFGKTMKYLSMTGALQSSAEGCDMLFEASKFLTFLKSALSAVGGSSSSVSTISSLASNYSGMKMGFSLSKK